MLCTAFTRTSQVGLLLLLTVMVPGCGGGGGAKGPPPVPASGTVTYQGSPVSKATVTFLGGENTRPAVGITDEAGHFALTTDDPEDGAVPGTYQVTVSKIIGKKAAASPQPQSMEAMAAAANKPQEEAEQPTSLLPEKYSSAATSGLGFDVKKGEKNEFKIELTE